MRNGEVRAWCWNLMCETTQGGAWWCNMVIDRATLGTLLAGAVFLQPEGPFKAAGRAAAHAALLASW